MRAQLSTEEQKVAVNAFANPAGVQGTGVRLAGEKFFVLRADERSVYGKKQVCLFLRLVSLLVRSGASVLFLLFALDGAQARSATRCFYAQARLSKAFLLARRCRWPSLCRDDGVNRSADVIFFARVQADGCVLVKTKQAVLVAEYAAPIQAPEATPIVEALADYLISVGY